MDSTVVQRQRVGAYGLCIRDRAVLLTRLSQNTSRPGSWTLPGGGVDHGEHPDDALIREVMEETGLHAQAHQVLLVDSARTVGAEVDHHAIRIIYRISTEDMGVPTVLDVGGSSDAAAWIPLDRLTDHPVVDMVLLALQESRRTG